MNINEHYMKTAIRLAGRAEGFTSPNPIVGALIVKGGRIVGRGYHKKAGLPHAEINALRQAGSHAKGATLYVNLEPCDHFGRTGPCTDSIIKSGIRKTVIGMKDPNPINNGRGIRRLNRSGIKTICGVLEDEAKTVNRPYIKFITTNMPYVTVKVAESLDGKIATRSGDSRWISSEGSRRYVHELRSKVDAVMVGVNTIIRDDPLLTARNGNGKEPLRIVVDSGLRTPIDARIFLNIKESPVVIAAAKKSNRIRQYERKGAEVLVVGSKKGRVDLRKLLKALANRNVTHVLVEGGGELAAGLVEERLVDRFLFFIAPKIIGGRDALTPVEGKGVEKVQGALVLKDMSIKKIKDDILIEAYT